MVGPQVEPIIRGVLRNQVQFLNSVSQQRLGFSDNVGLHPAAMRTTHPRDDAKATRVIAPLGDFYVGKMPRGQAKSGGGVVGNVMGPLIDINKRARGCRSSWHHDLFGMAEFFGSTEAFTRFGFGAG